MLFQQYLDNFALAVRTGGNFRDSIFDDAQRITDTPSQHQLMDFLSKLTAAVSIETRSSGGAKNGALAGDRGRAIQLIFDFVAYGGGGVFANIDKHDFAFQLALRVRSPRTIDQDRTTLCGPVAMVYDVAKRDPERYARFAISLFTTGTGQLGVGQITPSMTICNGYQKGLMPEVDYVVLASIRDSDAIVLSLAPLRNILTLTKPGALCEFMRQAGFTNIRDHSFLQLSTPLRMLNAVTKFGLNGANHNSFDQGLRNLHAAETQRAHGRFIVMNADVAVAQSFFDGNSKDLLPRPDPLPADETHWTAVRKLGIIGNTIRMKIVTWGGSYEGFIPKNALLSRYAGFISADP